MVYKNEKIYPSEDCWEAVVNGFKEPDPRIYKK
jgi:hypothetical protein